MQDAEHTEESAHPSVFDLHLNAPGWSDPFRWLWRGYQDFRRCPQIGLFYGLCFVLGGHALNLVFAHAPAYLMALAAGFILLGPFLCVGLYESSRALQKGLKPSFAVSLVAWLPTSSTMAIFTGVLLILEMLWGRATLVVFAVFFNTMPSTEGTLAQLLNPVNLEFLLIYSLISVIFGGLIFMVSAVAIPMIMARQVDAVTAGLTSLRACLNWPGPMFLWALLIVTLVVLSMVPYYLGLLITGPILGHASWHAYSHILSPTPTGASHDPTL